MKLIKLLVVALVFLSTSCAPLHLSTKNNRKKPHKIEKKDSHSHNNKKSDKSNKKR